MPVELFPAALVATAENLYAVPFVSPSMTQLVAAGVTIQVSGPGTGFPDASSAVTVYEVTAPLRDVPDAEDVIVIVALSLPATAVKVGVAGRSVVHCAYKITVVVSENNVTVWVST